MVTEILSVVALAVLCSAWVLVQLWVARHDPEQPGVEGTRCGSCRGSCHGHCENE